MNPLADADNICFFDTETRALPDAPLSDGDLKTAGTYRYAKSSFVIISTFALPGQPAFDVSLDRGFDGDWLCWEEMPIELREFHKRVEQREAWYMAFNAGFDRNVWNNGTWDFPRLDVDNVVDGMAQAQASNLAPSLAGAARNLSLAGKLDEGGALINLFCFGGDATPQSEPAKWELFKSYGRRDAQLLREVFQHTRPLPFEEWEDYWVSERINERGVGIDLQFIERAAHVALVDKARSNELLTRWTDGQITKVTEVQKMAQWVFDRVKRREVQNLLVKTFDKDATSEDEELKPAKLGLDRGRIEAVLAFFAALEKREPLADVDRAVVDVLTLRQFGGSTSPAKFAKMLAQHDDGRLKGQYVFNGAQQTGRFSSKGVQTHNLTRSTLGKHEAAAIEMINEVEI